MSSLFWQNGHPLTPAADALTAKYMPPSGPTMYVQSEAFRAGCRLHYDYYNNGFGNNMSQAVAYLEAYHNGSPEFDATFEVIKYPALHPFPLLVSDKQMDDAFDTVMSELVRTLQQADETNTLTPRDREMFDMPYVEQDDYDEDDEEEYEDD